MEAQYAPQSNTNLAERQLSSNSENAQIVWHTLEIEDVVKRLNSDSTIGLTTEKAAEKFKEYGPNELTQAKGRSLLTILFAQFKSLIIVLLIAAAAVAFILNENIEGSAILAVIFLNALIGFLTEWKAEQALTDLQSKAVPRAVVLRDKVERQVLAKELVPGDIVLLSAGEHIPADGRILKSKSLRVDEAILTGESKAVSKDSTSVAQSSASLGDRLNMVYLGTAVVDGHGHFIVTATGAQTEMGHIGTLIAETQHRETLLEQKLSKLGLALIYVVMALCGVIVVAGWLRGNGFLHMLEVGISLAIAAVPEGLPAVSTMTLAIGMQRMARMKALIRNLPAVETLGTTTVICTDKTGTLTKNEMTVSTLQLGDRRVEVSGIGYRAEGDFQFEGHRLNPDTDDHLNLVLKIGALCNDAKIETTDGTQKVLGDPTEAALIILAEKAGLTLSNLKQQFPRIGEVPFSSETRRMITFHRPLDGGKIAFVKGAPSVILKASQSQFGTDGICPLSDSDRKRILALNEEMAGSALRVLAHAFLENPDESAPAMFDSNLVFVGLVGMIDPLREEAKSAIQICHQAGIKVIMITGDQSATALEIGRQLGLVNESKSNDEQLSRGENLTSFDKGDWKKIVSKSTIFARVSPEDKLRIVEALEESGQIVAMTGDGVNDAPALKKADIGIAMGGKGTDIAKQASDMIILDDNFATIVSAVEQGRIIYSNILRFIHYLFSCNFSEILTMFIAIMIGWPMPLNALQILWLNMITDVFPSLALALEPSAPGIMDRPPRDPKEPLVTRRLGWLIGWQGLLICSATLIAYYVGMTWYGIDEKGLIRANTIAFVTLALAQVFHAFSARSKTRSAFTDRFFTNYWLWSAVVICVVLQIVAIYCPPLQRVLHTVSLDTNDWLLVLLCSLIPVVVVELLKLGQRKLKT